MRGWTLGALLVGAVLALGCGKTNADNPPDKDTGGDETSHGGRASGAAGSGATNGAGDQGAATSGGLGVGGAILPPDGPIPAATALHKLDLLLMVDNSLDMSEKQRLLKDAVGWLLGPEGPLRSADDVHVGVITSSLGSHGAVGAKDVCVSVEDNDHAHLLGSLRPGLVSFDANGFLAWGPDAASFDTVAAQLDPMLDAVGEQGCGYEASLEAWYRFLIDPEPPGTVVVPQGASTAVVADIDATVLSQRAAFLRPDSVLAIVVLSDENDCSIQDEGYGWLITRAAPMYRATSACAQDPNNKCCQSCAEATPNDGCPAISGDPACAQGNSLAAEDDDLNLRCWQQKRRFGFDLLYPIGRYVDGLTRQTVIQRSTGQPAANPIFDGRMRHPSQAILTGIVGVPWQDVADSASLDGPGLTLLTSAQLKKEGRWDVMIGDPDASPPVRATDAFMMETTIDRGILSSIHENPLTHDVIVPSSSMDPRANSINGHETNTHNRALQAACIMPRQTPKVCDEAAFNADTGCRCFQEDLVDNNALCQPPGGGAPTTTQHFEAAYPGIRHLQLLKALGDNAVTASICPKVFTPGEPDFGYRPAMRSLAARLERAFNP